MIEATCGACGTVARIAEADVPAGAKTVTCASCGARVNLPQKTAAAKPPPTPPKGIPAVPPAIPKKVPSIPGPKPGVELADLPAPKAKSALGDAPASKPAPRSGLDGADLPAPKSKTPSAAAAPASLDLDDLMPAAPKADAGISDLPAPKPRASALADAPPSKPAPSALADLPAPKAKSALADLPAPKAKSALADLPAPKAKAADLGDLPAPKAKGGLDLGDLPAPKAKGGLDLGGGDDDLDLPMPGGGGFSDLPMPKAGANNDLPAPKGFFDDLPQPAAKPTVDLPAPKGFFDDLPQPAKGAKGANIDLPAPKGFFDDLPQPSKTPAATSGGGGGGFFDDLPQPKAPPAAAGGGGGFFDDLPQPNKGPAAPAAGFGSGATGDFDLGLSSEKPFELADSAGGAPGPELDLGLPAAGGDNSFSDIGLSAPSSGPAKSSVPSPADEPDSPIKIKKSSGAPQKPIAITVKKDEKVDLKLELADDPHNGAAGAPAAATAGKVAAKKKAAAEISPEEKARKKKRSQLMGAAVLGVALLGGGGFYFYQKHAAAQARADEIAGNLAAARKAMGDANPNHWQKAAGAASAVLETDPNNPAALGLAAEAAIGGALDNGINYDARIKQGRKYAQQGIGAGKLVPELERAQALMAIAANQADRAIPLLTKLLGEKPKDGWLQLYMGWAQLAKGDANAAENAFKQAVALDAATKLPALYGHGQAKLMKADLEGAKSDFATVLETAKDHIGAQVGLAATLPPQQTAQKEADLSSILALPDLAKADPRAVVRAWVMVGDVARNSGRLDIARERYRKALALSALDLGALDGLAAVELRDGKMQVARDLITKALSANANDAMAQLLSAEADIVEGKLPDATTKLQALSDRQPPLPTLQMVRLHVVKGKLLEAQGKDEDAIAEYGEGAKLAGDLDLTPTMAAVTKLTDLAKKAPDEATGTGYLARADQLLQALAERAKEDGELSMTLGVAYLQANSPTKAEDFLRRAVTMREKDPESRLQLAKALTQLGRTDEAIAQLKDALALDPKRGDVALELARTYQNANMHTEAMAAYEKLLAQENVDTIVRVNAGRYFASRGARDKAAAQAEPILAKEPDNPGGLYLKAEGLMLAGKWDEARTALTRATDLDQGDAIYLDALGRAQEGSLEATNDTKFIEGARHAYERATKADPKLFHAHLGLGRMLIAAQHYDEAIKALGTASSIDKTNPEVMYNMGLAYYGVRNQSPAYKKTSADWFESALKSANDLTLEDRAETNYRLGELYFDLNKPQEAARSYDVATHLGQEIEKSGGKTPEWLTESFYKLGQVWEGLNNKPAQKKAWQTFIDRKPPPSERVNTANYALRTSLKTF